MHIVSDPANLPGAGRSLSLALGVFDGVHLGHQAVLSQARKHASQNGGLAVGVTFDPHPDTVITPDLAQPSLTTPTQKLALLEKLGMDALVVFRFDLDFSRQTAEEFVKSMASKMPGLRAVTVGNGFCFGQGARGNVDLLKRLGTEFGFVVYGMEPVVLNGKTISSTLIRDLISRGNLQGAEEMLGRRVGLEGLVVQGAQLGRQLGYPTANLQVRNQAVPGCGVYAGFAILQGRRHPAAINLGYRPTAGETEPCFQVEAHLLDFEECLYGQVLELEFVARLRDEIKFDSLDGLRKQISADIIRARSVLAP